MDHIRAALDRGTFCLLKLDFLVVIPGIDSSMNVHSRCRLRSVSFNDAFRALRLNDDRAVLRLQQVEFLTVICVVPPESLHVGSYFAAVAPHVEGQSAVVIPDRVEPAAAAGYDPSLLH